MMSRPNFGSNPASQRKLGALYAEALSYGDKKLADKIYGFAIEKAQDSGDFELLDRGFWQGVKEYKENNGIRF